MASWSFSQTNTLPPNGNVGIGTTTPTSTLQVNGCTHIDSSLVVKDSVIIHKSAHIKTDLKVDGITEFNNNVIINQGELKIKNLGDTSLADFGVLVIDGDGKVFNGGEAKSLVYSHEGQLEPPCAVAPNGATVYHAPDWYRATNPQQMYLASTLFKLYPNPSSTTATIELIKDDVRSFQYEVMDMSGKLIESGAVAGKTKHLSLPPGMYLVNVKTDESWESKKLVVY